MAPLYQCAAAVIVTFVCLFDIPSAVGGDPPSACFTLGECTDMMEGIMRTKGTPAAELCRVYTKVLQCMEPKLKACKEGADGEAGKELVAMLDDTAKDTRNVYRKVCGHSSNNNMKDTNNTIVVTNSSSSISMNRNSGDDDNNGAVTLTTSGIMFLAANLMLLLHIISL